MNFYFMDLDGTLEDSRQDMGNCVNIVRKKCGLVEMAQPEIAPYLSQGMDTIYKSCFVEWNTSPEKHQLIATEYEQAYLENVCIHTRCYEGIPKALDFLSRQGHVVVVTNKPERISRVLLERLDVLEYITGIVGGDSCAETKPSPMPLQYMADKLGFNREKHKAWMIGDSEGDMLAGRAFGAYTVWCAWGYAATEPLTRPDLVAHSPCDLLHLL